MDEITLVKQEISKAEWINKIKDCRSSGVTVQQWCDQNGISIKTYYYHLRHLREELIEQVPVPIVTTRKIVPIVIHIGNVQVDVPSNISPADLAALVKAFNN